MRYRKNTVCVFHPICSFLSLSLFPLSSTQNVLLPRKPTVGTRERDRERERAHTHVYTLSAILEVKMSTACPLDSNGVLFSSVSEDSLACKRGITYASALGQGHDSYTEGA
jgi:hypothetical protein